ncbi:MAG: glucose-6-phosphate isomerase [Salibacteraceae bacterium]|jgi:glucose-6-phosphate isomerase
MFKTDPTTTSSWKSLLSHYEENKSNLARDFFQLDDDRFTDFSISFNDFLVDYSKNNISKETLSLLNDLANECDLKDQIKAMFSGDKINFTENRSVLHTELRNTTNSGLELNGEEVHFNVKSELEKVKDVSNRFQNGELKGFTGKTLNTIVNIGVGGSDLGPLMIVEALNTFIPSGISTHFVSNVDGAHLSHVWAKIDPETTLFLVASKTFTTQETMANANSLREWMMDKFSDEDCIAKHFVAISTNAASVSSFGISQSNTFLFWDWVGGRFSLWSSIGLSISLSIGFSNFEDLLEGAHSMDTHFKEEDFGSNIPVLMALISIWHVNFCKYATEAILPYDQGLHRLPAYLQQLGMESNGKTTDRNGAVISYATSPVIWGEAGTNGQHSFYQLIQQGSQTVPADFIGMAKSQCPVGNHHDKLMANFFAQTEGLMNGKSAKKVIEDEPDLSKGLIPFKVFKGGVPTNSILIKELTPKNLGALVAIYEHKTFVQGAIWNINSFDQMGVELGKSLAKNILPELAANQPVNTHDSSTNGLINYFKSHRN